MQLWRVMTDVEQHSAAEKSFINESDKTKMDYVRPSMKAPGDPLCHFNTIAGTNKSGLLLLVSY